jgi:hypothetical protein
LKREDFGRHSKGQLGRVVNHTVDATPAAAASPNAKPAVTELPGRNSNRRALHLDLTHNVGQYKRIICSGHDYGLQVADSSRKIEAEQFGAGSAFYEYEFKRMNRQNYCKQARGIDPNRDESYGFSLSVWTNRQLPALIRKTAGRLFPADNQPVRNPPEGGLEAEFPADKQSIVRET